MKWLAFSAARSRDRSAFPKAVRAARFETRSMLPISAACVVANGVRETLSSLLRVSVGVRLFEPSIPSPQAWPAILERARLYRLRGHVADAAIVLRPVDAAALAAALFGESHPAGARDLSPIECDVIDRMVSTIAANFRGRLRTTRNGRRRMRGRDFRFRHVFRAYRRGAGERADRNSAITRSHAGVRLAAGRRPPRARTGDYDRSLGLGNRAGCRRGSGRRRRNDPNSANGAGALPIDGASAVACRGELRRCERAICFFRERTSRLIVMASVSNGGAENWRTSRC